MSARTIPLADEGVPSPPVPLGDVFHHAVVGMAIVDAEGRVIDANRAFARLVAAADPLARGFATLLHPDEQGAFAPALARALAGDPDVALDARLTGAGADPLPARLTLAPLGPARAPHVLVQVQDLSASRAHADDVAERKRTEAMLGKLLLEVEDQRRRLDNIIASVPGVVWEAWGKPDAASQRIDYVSEHVEKMLGYSRAEWLATPNFWLTIVHPDDQERAAREAAEHFLGDGGTLQFRWRRKDGSYLHAQAWNMVIRDATGAPVGMRGVTLDVSAVKQAEEAMRLSDERFRLVTRATSDAVWDWDLRTDALWWNDNFCTMFGYAADEIEPGIDSWTSRIHPDDLARVNAGILDAIANGAATWQDEYRFRRKDGQHAHILDRGFIIRDASGKGVRMVGSMMDVTDRRAAERELERMKHGLELILHSAGEGIYGVDADGNTTFMNAAALRMLGLREEDAVGRKLHAVIHHTHPDGRPYAAPECPIYQAAHGGPRTEVKGELFFRADGTPFRVDYVTAPIMDGGTVVGAVTVFTDVTERRRVEEQMARLAAIVQDSEDAIYAKTLEGIVTDWNPGAERLYGWTREQIVGQSVHAIVPEARRSEEERLLARIASGQRVPPFDTERRHADGHDVPVSLTVSPIRDGNGVVVGASTVARDISARRHAEAEIARREQLLSWQRVVLERIASGAALPEVLDTLCREAEALAPDHRFTVLLADETGAALRHGAAPSMPESYNRAVDGIPIGEGVGSCGTAAFRRQPVQVEDVQTDPLWKDFRALAASAGVRSCWSTPILAADGRLLGTWAVYRSTPGMPEPSDQRIGSIATRLAGLAIARREADRALVQRAEELAAMADALQKSNRELDQFAYITSHDLKAPLRGIANLSRWIEEDLGAHVTPETHEHLELLRGRVNRMEALIDAILEYSRIGRVKARPERIEVGPLLHDVVDLLAPPPGVRVEVKEPMPTLVGERMRLQQVFMNLIGNAVKHHHRKEDARIEVAAEDAGRFWRFSVKDDGPGIAPRFHEKVFVIFQTLEARDKVEGAGIGLALVKKTVESYGGTVTLESDVGKGATFRFTWPKTIAGRETT